MRKGNRPPCARLERLVGIDPNPAFADVCQIDLMAFFLVIYRKKAHPGNRQPSDLSFTLHATISVPIPFFVNISRSMEWVILPSIMCVFFTPPSIADRQALTFGRIAERLSPLLLARRAPFRF